MYITAASFCIQWSSTIQTIIFLNRPQIHALSNTCYDCWTSKQTFWEMRIHHPILSFTSTLPKTMKLKTPFGHFIVVKLVQFWKPLRGDRAGKKQSFESHDNFFFVRASLIKNALRYLHNHRILIREYYRDKQHITNNNPDTHSLNKLLVILNQQTKEITCLITKTLW